MQRRYITQSSSDRGNLYTKYCNTTIARSHSLLQKIDAIINHHIINEITTISIRGREGTGKSNLAQVISHLLHDKISQLSKEGRNAYTKQHIERMQAGYIVRILTSDDLMNFTETLKNLPHKNRILIFDDVSFIPQLKDIKNDITKIRHSVGGDFKTVLIYNFHYSKGLDKYLRDTHFIFQTSITNEEKQNLKDLMGKNNAPVISIFNNIHNVFMQKGQVTINLRNKGNIQDNVKYEYSNPFRLTLFYDGRKAAIAVYPNKNLIIIWRVWV